jgi:hypothetical protein
MRKTLWRTTLAVVAIWLAGCVPPAIVHEDIDVTAPLHDVAIRKTRALADAVQQRRLPFFLPPSTRLDTVVVDSLLKTVRIGFSRHFSFPPYREDNVRGIYDSLRSFFGFRFHGFNFSVETDGKSIEDLVPNFYRNSPARYDSSRLARKDSLRPMSLVRNVSNPCVPTMGLLGRSIVVSPSHGWFYRKERDRWEWQRPRLFQSVEDLIPMSFVIPYLLPMLEHAGATVFVTRERDPQIHEVVVDNDARDRGRGTYREKNVGRGHAWKKGPGIGFGPLKRPYAGNENPFVAGTHRVCLTDAAGASSATWIPEIPEDGEYAVSLTYVASDTNVTDAHYTVYHAGGATTFLVNQTIGGSTWIYLGQFQFKAGRHPASGKVVLTNRSATSRQFVSADAVRFGGGMGMIVRNGRESGRPRFAEGARYFLQYAGMPDTLVYTLTNNADDYRDDYLSRPEYANYLRGAPFGPTKSRTVKGLGIPVDLCLSFHTDAGITHNDSTVGTLAIYSIEGADSLSVFPDGVSRMANRDLADIVQTQIVRDLRMLYDPIWSRRDMWDAKYHEAMRPNMPSLLLELLSHQNFLDMRFVQDPSFRFDVSRAIYKGILRFLATHHGFPYIVQPLPVTHFEAMFSGPREVTLRWRPRADSLEPTAQAHQYVVYTRVGEGGFDNGVLVDRPETLIRDILPGVLYSFKVTAVNEGGESFPSEILSVCRMRTAKDPVLIINGFDRVSPPAWIETPQFSGFLNILDAGVPDRRDFSFTGEQFDFDPASQYRTDDGPGHGTSQADHETELVAGNTFDFVSVHGTTLMKCGYSFVSSSRDAVLDSMVELPKFKFVDVLLGKQRETHWQKAIADSIRKTKFAAFPPKLRSLLRDYVQSGGNLFVSGAYVGFDIFGRKVIDSTAAMFANQVLRYAWATDHASRKGQVFSVDSSFMTPTIVLHFNTSATPMNYAVDSPDAITPAGGSRTILRYAENQFSAGTGYYRNNGVVVIGFPFESISSSTDQVTLMKAVLKFLKL